MTKRCPDCSESNPESAKKCTSCGFSLKQVKAGTVSAHYYPDIVFADKLSFHSALLYFDHVYITCPDLESGAEIPFKDDPDTKLYTASRVIFQKFYHENRAAFDEGVLRRFVKDPYPTKIALQQIGHNNAMARLPDEAVAVIEKSFEATLTNHTTYSISQAEIRGENPPPVEQLKLEAYLWYLSYRYFIERFHDMVLLTDNTIHAKAYLETQNAIPMSKILENTQSKMLASHAKAFELFKTVLDVHLPPIMGASIEDILEIRQKLDDHLLGVRTEMRNLSSKISELPWEESFGKEAINALTGPIEKELYELKKKLQSPGRQVLKYIFSDTKTLTTAGATFGLSILSGAPVETASILGASSSILSAAAKTLITRSNTKSASPFTFLLESNTQLRKLIRNKAGNEGNIWGGRTRVIVNALEEIAEGGKRSEAPWLAEIYYRTALELRQEHLENDKREIAHSLFNLAESLMLQKKYSGCEELCKRSLKMREDLVGKEHEDFASSLYLLALLKFEHDDVDKAYDYAIEALEIRKNVLDDQNLEIGQSHYLLANILRKKEREDEAYRHCTQALSIRTKILGPEHPLVAESHCQAADLLQNKDEYETAAANLIEAIKIRDKAKTQDLATIVLLLDRLARLLSTRGQFEDAEPHARRCAEIAEKLFEPDSMNIGIALDSLASILGNGLIHKSATKQQVSLADIEEAEQINRKALAIFEKNSVDKSFEGMVLGGRLHMLESLREEYEIKEGDHTKIIKETLKKDPQNLISLIKIADHLNDAKRYEDALDACEIALSLNPNYDEALNTKGEILANQGKILEAISAFKSCLQVTSKQYIELLEKKISDLEKGRKGEDRAE